MAGPIQRATNTGLGTGTVTVTLSATGTGHSLIVYVATYGSGSSNGTVSSIALGATGDTFSQAVGLNGGNTVGNQEIWHDLAASSGQTSVVVTFTGGNAGSLNLVAVEEWAKLSSLDKTSSNDNSGQSSFTSNATATLSQANEIVVGAAEAVSSSSSMTLTGPSSPWTNQSQISGTNGSSHNGMITGWVIPTTTAAQTYSGTISPSESYSAVIASYIPSGITVNLPVAQVVKTAFTVGPSMYVNLPVSVVHKTAPLATPGIVLIVHLPAASVQKSAFNVVPATPAILLLSIAGRAGTDPYGLTPYPAGFTSFEGNTAGPANNTYTYLSTGVLNYVTNGLSAFPGTLETANFTGTLFASSGLTSTPGDDAASVLMVSADQTSLNTTGLSLVELDANNVQLTRRAPGTIPVTAPSVSGADGIAIVNALKTAGIFV